MIQRFAFVLLVLLISLRALTLVYDEREKFFVGTYNQEYQSLTEKYNKSQYHQKKNPVSMSDSDFEKFAGGIFLKGLNPILIVHDHPPLGRYVVSLSILLFNNPHTIMLVMLVLIVISMYLLSRKVITDPFLSLIPVGIFINDQLFLSRIIETPLPEPIQLPFILFAFWFFLKALDGKRSIIWFVCTSLMLGAVISTRFFVLGLAMMGSMGLYLLYIDRLQAKTRQFILTLPLSLIVLFASYTRTIQESGSIFQVLSIQKYILAYHKSKFVLPFTVWDLLLFNRWHTWWADRKILSDPQWTIFWPIAVGGTLGLVITGFRSRFRGFTNGEKFLLLWVTVHLTMLSTGYTSSRYFLSLVPVLYILATAFGVRVMNHFFPPDLRSSVKTK